MSVRRSEQAARWYAAISAPSVGAGYLLVPARKHVYHASLEAAERALVRAGRRAGAARGFIWPVAFPNALRDGDYERVTTIAL